MSPVNASVIGRSIPRVDGRQKVAGLTRFAGDVQLPGMLHARLVLAPHPHARITRIATDGARAVPGVVGVFTGRDLPVSKPDPGNRSRSPLAVDEVLFNGHPVVAVVAETEAIAEDAAALVEIEYEELPAGAYHAPGAVPATFAIESQIDEIACAIGIDPLDLRMRNAAGRSWSAWRTTTAAGSSPGRSWTTRCRTSQRCRRSKPCWSRSRPSTARSAPRGVGEPPVVAAAAAIADVVAALDGGSPGRYS